MLVDHYFRSGRGVGEDDSQTKFSGFLSEVSLRENKKHKDDNIDGRGEWLVNIVALFSF